MRGWGDQQRSCKQIVRLFNETFLNENNRISKTTIVRTIQRFEESDSVRNCPKSGRPATATSKNKALDLLSKIFYKSRCTTT